MNSKKTKPTRIYLSGPIRGYDLPERHDTFLAKQVCLEAKGHKVFNPLRNGLPIDATDEQHMRRDITELIKCDAVLFMKGWQRSRGCKTEFAVATDCGLDVYFEESFDINSIQSLIHEK